MVEYREVAAQKVLNKYKHRDNWYWCRYSINPYRGCQFACNYCDAITEKYLVHKDYRDFSRIIYIKTNAAEQLRKELKRVKRDVVSLGGVTDAYQPAEEKYQVTRRVLNTLKENRFPVSLVTKSDLVLRDIDILTEMMSDSWCAVSVTIITFDDHLLRLLEPFAPRPERRLKAVQVLAEEGINVGVVFTPIIPYICDSDKNLRDVIERAHDSGARYVLSGSMTLRSNQKTRFLELLRKNYPNLLERYLSLYRNSQNPDSRYQTAINRKTFELCGQLGIPA